MDHQESLVGISRPQDHDPPPGPGGGDLQRRHQSDGGDSRPQPWAQAPGNMARDILYLRERGRANRNRPPPGRGRGQALVPQARASSNVATDNTSHGRWTRAGSVLLVLSHFHPRLLTPRPRPRASFEPPTRFRSAARTNSPRLPPAAGQSGAIPSRRFCRCNTKLKLR